MTAFVCHNTKLPTGGSSRGQRLLTWMVVFVGAGLAFVFLFPRDRPPAKKVSVAVPAGEPEISPEPDPLDASASEIPLYTTPAEKAYLRAGAALRLRAVATGRVTYAEVLQVAYPEGMITPQVLAHKAAYRRRVEAHWPFFADYYAMREEAEIREQASIAEIAHSQTATGAYLPRENLIVIRTSALGMTLFHECGHTLQRREPSGSVFSDFVAVACDEGRISTAESSATNYLINLQELEVSLQDLNRFYANFVAGRPIMRPEDTVRALLALGVAVPWNEVESGFQAEHRPITYLDYLGWSHDPGYSQRSAYACPSARRLGMTLALAQKANPAVASALLRYLIFAAPGHV